MTPSTHALCARDAHLAQVQSQALSLLAEAERRGLFRSGVTELQLSREIQALGCEMFGRLKHWHKRIVRAGSNTLLPYRESLTDLPIGPSDILFVDMGPVFEGWEADVGRTYVVGDDPSKLRLRDDAARAWQRGPQFYQANAGSITGADLWAFANKLANELGYEFGGPHAGHLIGDFPHEHLVSAFHPKRTLAIG